MNREHLAPTFDCEIGEFARLQKSVPKFRGYYVEKSRATYFDRSGIFLARLICVGVVSIWALCSRRLYSMLTTFSRSVGYAKDSHVRMSRKTCLAED